MSQIVCHSQVINYMTGKFPKVSFGKGGEGNRLRDVTLKRSRNTILTLNTSTKKCHPGIEMT